MESIDFAISSAVRCRVPLNTMRSETTRTPFVRVARSMPRTSLGRRVAGGTVAPTVSLLLCLRFFIVHNSVAHPHQSSGNLSPAALQRQYHRCLRTLNVLTKYA